MKKKVNKSQLIREHLAVASDKSPKAVVGALARKGVKVSSALVGMVKNRGNGRLVRHATALAKHSEALADARRLVERAGGLEGARSLLEVVGKIMG